MPDDEAKVAALQNEVEGWRRLAWRLLNQGPLFRVMNAQPRLGTLPDRLPYNLPLPPDSRIVGSVADETKAYIYLDTAQSPAEVWQFYRAKMQVPEQEIVVEEVSRTRSVGANVAYPGGQVNHDMRTCVVQQALHVG